MLKKNLKYLLNISLISSSNHLCLSLLERKAKENRKSKNQKKEKCEYQYSTESKKDHDSLLIIYEKLDKDN
uniref:Uncharacterized protein n=1 Tax=Rhizophagus irregularis (strain DAOM 181602 / DAOM 197198 / MUCL 43194) TaxID=747089 RepID=U9TFV8_RHIID